MNLHNKYFIHMYKCTAPYHIKRVITYLTSIFTSRLCSLHQSFAVLSAPRSPLVPHRLSREFYCNKPSRQGHFKLYTSFLRWGRLFSVFDTLWLIVADFHVKNYFLSSNVAIFWQVKKATCLWFKTLLVAMAVSSCFVQWDSFSFTWIVLLLNTIMLQNALRLLARESHILPMSSFFVLTNNIPSLNR